jgi:signal-transduction protein with cAMP-binding, CBS, and nucleotidyltransferase domain
MRRSLEERTVKQLRLTRALTLPETTTVSEACRRMAARRVDAALLTDDKGMLAGIVTAEVRIRRSRKRLLWSTCCTFGETNWYR